MVRRLVAATMTVLCALSLAGCETGAPDQVRVQQQQELVECVRLFEADRLRLEQQQRDTLAKIHVRPLPCVLHGHLCSDTLREKQPMNSLHTTFLVQTMMALQVPGTVLF